MRNKQAFPGPGGLWYWESTLPFLSGTLADGTPFEVKVVTTATIIHGTLFVGNKKQQEHSHRVVDSNETILACTMINTWVEKVYWAGIDNPTRWATAGCRPSEARTQLALPENHPERLPNDALEVLASLRSGGGNGRQ